MYVVWQYYSYPICYIQSCIYFFIYIAKYEAKTAYLTFDNTDDDYICIKYECMHMVLIFYTRI